MHINIYESKSWQITKNERFIPELTWLCVFSYLDKLVPLCQSISSDLKSRQSQHLFVMYCVVLRCVVFMLCFVLCCQCCVVLCFVLCCLLGFELLLILKYCLIASHERNKYIQHLTSINTVSEILNLLSYLLNACYAMAYVTLVNYQQCAVGNTAMNIWIPIEVYFSSS